MLLSEFCVRCWDDALNVSTAKPHREHLACLVAIHSGVA
jgi:hypothetical protein